jgi:hypothetical protein
MHTKAREVEQVSPLSWNWLNPAMGAQAAYNAKLHEAFAALSNEWQTFVCQRLKEDLNLMREIGATKTPEQLWSIAAKFWQKAIEDYAREYATIAKLAGNCAICGVSIAEEALHAQPETMPPFSKAA